MASQTLL